MVLSRITIHFTENWRDERQQRQSPENSVHYSPDKPPRQPLYLSGHSHGYFRGGKIESNLPPKTTPTVLHHLSSISVCRTNLDQWTILELLSFLLTRFEVKSCKKIRLLTILPRYVDDTQIYIHFLNSSFFSLTGTRRP